MSSDSFRHKVADLTRKSRKAVKLYSNVAKKPSKCSEEWVKDTLGDIQIDEWRKTNAELHRELCRILEIGSQRTLVASVFELRDSFYNNWRKRETDSRTLQRDLITCIESNQYSKVVSLGYKLSGLNAQIQALQAAYQELQSILKGFSSGNEDRTIRSDSNSTRLFGRANQHLTSDQEKRSTFAKIIPINRKVG